MTTQPVKEKKITVAEATLIAFTRMGQEFHVINLVAEVRLITERPALMDGTVTRALRDAKQSGQIDYDVIDQKKGIYKKVRDWNNPAIKNQLSLF